MEFDNMKYAHITMIAGKLASVSRMEILFGEVMSEQESDKCFKYLGILEANGIMHTKIKDKI